MMIWWGEEYNRLQPTVVPWGQQRQQVDREAATEARRLEAGAPNSRIWAALAGWDGSVGKATQIEEYDQWEDLEGGNSRKSKRC